MIFIEAFIHLIIPSGIFRRPDIITFISITPLLVFITQNMDQLATSLEFPIEVILDLLNMALKNDGDEGINHSYKLLNISRENTSSLLNSLASIPELISNTLLHQLFLQISTKLPSRLQHIA